MRTKLGYSSRPVVILCYWAVGQQVRCAVLLCATVHCEMIMELCIHLSPSFPFCYALLMVPYIEVASLSA